MRFRMGYKEYNIGYNKEYNIGYNMAGEQQGVEHKTEYGA